MSNTFFTSDHHLGHANIIKHCNRPFATVEEMNEVLIVRWNERVANKDTVYHLGDIVFRSAQNPRDHLDRLNGKIHLIRGNHDKVAINQAPQRFESISDLLTLKINHQKFVLCHYSMRVWDSDGRGSYHLYGHSHGKLPGIGLSRDVGVDTSGFYPLSLEDIESYFEKLKSDRGDFQLMPSV